MSQRATNAVTVLCLFIFTTLARAAGSEPAASEIPLHPVKVYHDRSLRDLDAIGNRNVGCGRGLGNWYTIDGQIRMGKEYSQQVEQTAKMVKDPVVTEYINRIGQNLVRNSDSLVPFTIRVIDSDDVNAFALPGGFFYVNSGLILAADNEAELAGVMAHEIAHVAACHAARENTRGQLMNLASIPLIFVGGGIGYAAQNLAGLAFPMTFLKFSRGFETEADFLGVQYLYKAGYDPQAFTAFFEKVQALEKKKPGTLAKAFDTHPQTPDRLARSQHEIQTLLPPEPEYKLDSSEFQEVKARLAELENRHKINDQKDGNRPTLRRGKSQPDDTGGTGKDQGDERPTLKRRPAGDQGPQ
jgi:predicted Zn-dependent protease